MDSPYGRAAHVILGALYWIMVVLGFPLGILIFYLRRNSPGKQEYPGEFADTCAFGFIWLLLISAFVGSILGTIFICTHFTAIK